MKTIKVTRTIDGAKLKALRLDKSLSQQDAAKQLRIGVSMLSRFESGLSIPTGDTLIQLCDFYGAGLDDIAK